MTIFVGIQYGGAGGYGGAVGGYGGVGGYVAAPAPAPGYGGVAYGGGLPYGY